MEYIDQLKQLANENRKRIINMIYKAKSGHEGGSLSIIDMLTAIYELDINFNENPRSKVVLSKGHTVPAQYAVLNSKGIIKDDEMNTLVNIAKEKIEQCINDISEARFDINPKVDEDNNIGCLYCKYKDICFMKKKDEIEIKKDKDLEYLGGDNNV